MERLKRFLAVFLVVVIMIGGLPVYAASNAGSSAKLEYLKAEKKFFDKVKKDFEKSELGHLLKFAGEIDGTYNDVLEVEIKLPEIKDRKYVISGNGTFTDRYEDGIVEAYVEGEKVATFNVVASEDKISIQVPELYEKYLTVDMTDLEGLVRKFTDNDEIIKVLPKGMVYDSDSIKILKLTKAEEKIVEKAIKKYSKLFEKELLKNEYFKKGNNETLDVNGLSYKCKTVSYEISLKDLLDGIKKIWTEVKKDTEFINLIWAKVEAIYDFNSKITPTSTTLPTKEQVMAVIDTLFDKLEESSLSIELEKILLKSVLYHQNGELIKRDIKVKALDEETNVMSIYTINNSKQEYYAFEMEDSKIEDNVTRNSKETFHNIAITSMRNEYDFSGEELVINKKEEVQKCTIKITKVKNNHYNIEFLVDGSDIKFSMEYIKNKETSKEYDLDLNFKVLANGKNFEVNTGLIYKKDIKLNKINTKSNEIVLNEKSKEELVKLWEDNKETVMEKIKGKFGSAFYYEEIQKMVNSL